MVKAAIVLESRKFKRKRRSVLAAQVPLDPHGVLVDIVHRRLKWALNHNCHILSEGAEFWNDVVSST